MKNRSRSLIDIIKGMFKSVVDIFITDNKHIELKEKLEQKEALIQAAKDQKTRAKAEIAEDEREITEEEITLKKYLGLANSLKDKEDEKSKSDLERVTREVKTLYSKLESRKVRIEKRKSIIKEAQRKISDAEDSFAEMENRMDMADDMRSMNEFSDNMSGITNGLGSESLDSSLSEYEREQSIQSRIHETKEDTLENLVKEHDSKTFSLDDVMSKYKDK